MEGGGARDTSGAVHDAARGALRVAVVLALPAALGTLQAAGSAKTPRLLVLAPITVLLLASILGAVVGIVRARRTRSLAQASGLGFTPRLHARTFVGPTTQFPFDDGRRRAGDGAAGLFAGFPAALFAYGARTLVHAVHLERPLPPMQMVPTGAAGAYDVGLGVATATESYHVTREWRIVAPDARYAHAALPPTVLDALAAVGSPRPIVAWDGTAIWTVDRGVRLKPEQSVRRFELLTTIASRIPDFVSQDYERALVAGGGSAAATEVREASVPAFAQHRRQKNALARLSVLLAFTFFGTPLGIWLGLRALRASREGSADNRRVAIAGIVLSSLGLVLSGLMVFAAVTVD